MTDVTTVREIERKLSVDAAFKMPDLMLSGAPVVTEQPTVVLNAAYYDTDDLRLARFGVTLRRRTGGSDAGWHLKLPESSDRRMEVRVPLGTCDEEAPPELLDRVRAFIRDRAVEPVMSLGTRRLVHRLLDADGAILAELCDDHVTAKSRVQRRPKFI